MTRKRGRALRANEPTMAELIERGGGEKVVFAMVAAGDSINKIAWRFGRRDRDSFYLWVNASEERKQKFEAAKVRSADAHAEKGWEVLEKTKPESSAHVQLAKEKAGYQRWFASVRDRKQYGENKDDATKPLSIGELHLYAIQQVKQMMQAGMLPPKASDSMMPALSQLFELPAPSEET